MTDMQAPRRRNAEAAAMEKSRAGAEPGQTGRRHQPIMKHLPLAITVLLLLGALGYSALQYSELGKLRASQAELDRDRAELRKKLWDLQKQLAARPKPGAARASAPESTEGAPALATDGEDAAPERGRRRGPEAGRAFNPLENPQMQQMMALQQKAALDGKYARLFKQLNLNPAELDQFKGLLVDKQSAIVDVLAAARSQGLGGREGREEVRALMQATQEEIDGQIRSLLGESAYTQFKNYEKTEPQRALVGQLEQRLSYSSTPLSESQSEQLVQILARTAPEERPANSGLRAFSQGFVGANSGAGALFAAVTGGGASVTDTAVQQAQSVLSTPQVAALQQLQQEQQTQAQLSRQMREAFGRRNTRGGDATPANRPTPAVPLPAPPGG
jgi:hypothetical protein